LSRTALTRAHTANSEIALVNNKLAGARPPPTRVANTADHSAELERDRELDRRKIRELQDGARERDKEYQKLKVRLRSRPLCVYGR
jgi:E3 ubiquitin-protein ligase CCNP1IP1